jgi:serine/threonine-protein kinase
MRARLLLAFAISWAASAPLVASAQGDPAAHVEAQVLFDEASALMDKHDYASACPKLEEVRRLVPEKLGGLMTLAECYEGAGRLASAWTAYRQAADRATTVGDPRVREAQSKADAIAPRLPRLSVQLGEDTKGLAGLAVMRDGVSVGSALWGVPVPVDPGEHVVEARAPEHRTFRAIVTMKERESQDVVVELERVAPETPVTPPPVIPPSRALVPAPRPVGAPRPVEPPRDDGRRRAGLAVGIAGVAGLGIAGVLGIVTLAEVSDLPRCGNSDVACIDDRRNPGIRSAQAVQAAGFVLLGVGAAATATGFTLFATAPRAAKPVAVSTSVGPSGVTMRGAW